MPIGRVVEGRGGFYFIKDGDRVVMATARGNLKRDKRLIYVGDIVEYKALHNNEFVVTKIKERINFLTRPPVSNIEMLVVVFATANPQVNYPVIDKLIVASEFKNIDVAICITKSDLVSEEALREQIQIYEDIYPSVAINGVTGEGIEGLKKIIRGKNIALAGPSGVGKSTIINHITGGLLSETGDISSKTRRGKHTTRHVEIFSLSDGTNIYDTPGFTSLDLPEIDITQVREAFPEFRDLNHKCRYSDCIHVNEPECAVKKALNEGKISKTRYESYCLMLEEVKKWQR
ncbi:MAG: ribosome small subunit-dependent GTPase A [Clostridiales bacterium]|nr:ribosome small subunit-dependent GTPase A [Clostridiales bacterium]